MDASTMRGKTPGMVETIANRAWTALSPQQQLAMIVQAREEELRQPATSPPDSDHDVPIVPSPIQIATSNSSSDRASLFVLLYSALRATGDCFCRCGSGFALSGFLLFCL